MVKSQRSILSVHNGIIMMPVAPQYLILNDQYQLLDIIFLLKPLF